MDDSTTSAPDPEVEALVREHRLQICAFARAHYHLPDTCETCMNVRRAIEAGRALGERHGAREAFEAAAQRAEYGYQGDMRCNDIAADIRALADGTVQGGCVWMAEDWKAEGAREVREWFKALVEAEAKGWSSGGHVAAAARRILSDLRARGTR